MDCVWRTMKRVFNSWLSGALAFKCSDEANSSDVEKFQQRFEKDAKKPAIFIAASFEMQGNEMDRENVGKAWTGQPSDVVSPCVCALFLFLIGNRECWFESLFVRLARSDFFSFYWFFLISTKPTPPCWPKSHRRPLCCRCLLV